METVLQDIRYALRIMIKSPVFTGVAVVALALGIGSATAIFSVINAVLLKPLQFKEPSRLVQIWGKFDKQGLPQNWISEPELWDLKQQTRSFEDLAGFTAGGANLTGSGDPVRVNSALVNASFFRLLGIQAAKGRTFYEEEDRPGANTEVILSDSLWKSRFAGDPGIVGRAVTLSGQSFTVVGIMPQGFDYPAKSDLWEPLALDAAKPGARGSHYLEVLGRLRPGLTLQQASSDLAGVATVLLGRYPDNYGGNSGWGMYAIPLKTQMVGDVRPAMLVLLGAVTFLLLIACANVANLLLVRATVREKEIAIRAALGAGRRRLVKQLLTESVMLALAGGAIGFALAYAAVKAFVAFGPKDLPRLDEVAVNWPVLIAALGLSLATGLVFGVFPALHLSRPDLHRSLKEGGRTQAGGRSGMTSALVVSEGALALILLVGAGLMMKSFRRLLEVPLGFTSDHLLTFRITLPPRTYPDGTKLQTFYDSLLEKVRRIPGVETAGAVSQLPLSGAYSSGTTIVEDTSAGPGLARVMGLYPMLEADRREVTPGYFESMHIPLKEGRMFTPADNDLAPKVVIIDEKFARTFWPKADPLGKRVLTGGSREKPEWGTIVGVAGHVRHYGLEKEGREQLYFPFDQKTSNTMYLTLRTSGDPDSVVGAARSAVMELDRGEPIYQVKSMDELLAGSIAQPRLYLALFVAFAAVALVLAAVGIYGMMSYAVTQRTNEIGVRMALGATAMDVVRLVTFRGLLLTGGGLVIGLAGSFGLTRLMVSLLYAVSPTDPATFVLISLLLGVVAIAACVIPARRATRVDPLAALRYE
ncbi:MAG TPA: ABC transporter permease [Blastocatellia bacterium]|nr:ABC transporter permease [Blastocatellia bacterium]